MMRDLRLVLYFVVGLCLGGVSVLAQAETIPATATTTDQPATMRYWMYPPEITYGSGPEACNAAYPSIATVFTDGRCYRADNNYGLSFVSSGIRCVDGTDPGGGTCSVTTYSCPPNQNWTLSGQQCVRSDCVAPAVRKPDGTCGCEAGKSVGPITLSGSSAKNCVIGPCGGMNGCEIGNCTSGYGAGGIVVATGCKQTGNNAGAGSPTAQPAPPPNPPPDQPQPPPTPEGCVSKGQGYITNSSGTTVCLQQGAQPSTDPVEKAVKKTATQTATGPAGETGTKTVDTVDVRQASGDGVSVTRTSTTTVTGSGSGGTGPGPYGTPGTTTADETMSQDSFCEQYPNSAICKETKDPCDENPDRASCADLGTPEDGPSLGTEAVGLSSLTPVGVAGNNACPADIPLPKGMTFKWTPICDGASMLRPLVLALAWLAAGFTLIGGARRYG